MLVRNSPLGFTDPTGHAAELIEGGPGECPISGDCWYWSRELHSDLYGFQIGTTLEEIAHDRAALRTIGEIGVGVLCDACDMAIAASDGVQWYDTLSAAPIIPAGVVNGAVRLIGRYGDEIADGVQSLVRGFCSFSEDTLVMTEAGLVPISDVELYDYVLGFNEITGEIGYFPVVATWAHVDPIIVTLTIDGEIIETTPEHPFYTDEGEWIAAGELQPGDEIRTSAWETGMVDSVTFVSAPQTMYNFTVDTAHTYFVGEGQWLVHNSCAALIENAISRGLPYRNGVGPTTGYLYDADGNLIDVIVSGANKYSDDATLPRNYRGPLYNQTHVEAQAAGMMRDLNISEATLVLNNHSCPTCDETLRSMVPVNSKLHVIVPEGYDIRGAYYLPFAGE